MPIIHKHISRDYSVAIWKIDESIEELAMLHPEGATWLLSMKDIPPHLQAIRTAERLLIDTLCPRGAKDFGHTPSGIPYLKNHNTQISISHTRRIVGLETSRTGTPGIDLEYISPRIGKLLPRVCSQEELKLLNAPPDRKDLRATLIWCGKEAMFKSAQGDIKTISQVKVTHIEQTHTPYLRAEYQTRTSVVEKYFGYTLIDGSCIFVFSLPAVSDTLLQQTNKFPITYTE